jgi:predicted transcriptional regulator
LVGTPCDKTPTAVKKLLEDSGLMANRAAQGQDPQLVITQKGFQFLLQDVKFQIWAFLLQYLETASEVCVEGV